MEEINKDFMLLDEEDDDNSNNNNNNNNNNNRFVSSYDSKVSKSNPFISPNKTKSISTISIQRPRSSGQMKAKGLDDYIETYKSTTNNNSNALNDNRIKINLKIEDLSIKNENVYQTLDDHSIMTGDDFVSTSNQSRRVSSTHGSKVTSRRQSFDDNNDDNDDDEEDNLKYKYTASYKIDEHTGGFKEDSRITFEKNEMKFQQKTKKAPPIPPPPPPSQNVSSKPVELVQVKNEENKKFFNDFLLKSDDLIAKTQMKLEELSKKGPAPSLPPAPIVQSQSSHKNPVATVIGTTTSTDIKSEMNSFIVDETVHSRNLLSTTPPPTSKSLIDLKTFDIQPTIEETIEPQQTIINQTQVDLLFDINNNQFTLNTEPLKQGDSYFDLIGLTKSDSQYNNVSYQQQSTSYKIPNELLTLETSNEETNNTLPLSSPYKDELLDFIINDNNSTSVNNNVNNNYNSFIKSDILTDLLTNQNKDDRQNDFRNNDAKMFAPEIQITEPCTEQNDDNIVPIDLFNMKNEVPYNQSRPITPVSSFEPIKDSQNILSDIEALLNSNTAILNEENSSSTKNIELESKILESTKIKKEAPVIKSRFASRGQTKIKKYSRKDGIMSNDDGTSSSEEENEQSQFKIRIRPRAQSITSLEEENKSLNGFQLLSKPPKTAAEIQTFQLTRRSQESLDMTSKLKDDESSDDDKNQINNNNNNDINYNNTTIIDDDKNTSNGQRDRKQSEISEISIEMPDEDDIKPLDEFLDKDLCQKELEEGWILMIRYPLRNPQLIYKKALQKITEIRAWTETVVKIIDNGKKLKLFYPHDLENSFHEIELKSAFKFTDLSLQQFDTYTKIHTFKIQEIIFKEMLQIRPDRLTSLPERLFKHFSKPKVTSFLDHTPIPFEVIKFAHMNYRYLSNFVTVLQENFWKLPIINKKQQRELQKQKQQQQQSSSSSQNSNVLQTILPASLLDSKHSHEEITVKVIDEYKCKLDKKCRILEHRCRTRVFLVAFLNVEEPIIEIGLNDCLRHGKEIVGRHDIIPIKTETWISPETFELNESIVDKTEFEKNHSLKCFDVPDNQIIEILRYRTRPRRNYELPLNVNCTMTIVKRKIEIKIECMIAGTYFTKLNEVFCENIQIRFPLPDAWVYLFRVEKRFRYGALHSTKSKFGKFKGFDRFLLYKSNNNSSNSSSSNNTGSSSSSTSNTKMEASCGHAKYEQAFKSIVWRIDQLPLKNKDVYKTQLFLCRINLQDYDTLPEAYEPHAEVQYTMPICASSKSQVRSISVNTDSDEPPNKWVKLKTKFDYQLEINYVLDKENDELPTLNTEDCDELKHISQSESEVDNDDENENDDNDENIDNLDKIKQQPSEAVLIDLL